MLAKSLLVVLCCTVTARSAASEVQVRQEDGHWVIDNGRVARVIETAPTLRTVFLVNRLVEPARRHAVESREFMLALGQTSLTATDFRVEGVEPVQTGSKAELVVRLVCREHGLRVTVRYELAAGQPCLRKRLDIDPGKQRIDWVDVESFRLADLELKRFDRDPMPFPGVPWDIVVGRPLFAGREMFLGVEHPASVNSFDENRWISLRQHPGRQAKLTTAPAVIGFCADRPHEHLLDAMEQYVRANRARPVKRSIQWVAYFPAGLDDEACRQKIAVAQRVFRSREVPLDMVLMDSGWTEPQSIMRISSKRPDRLALMSQLAKDRLGCGLGLHVITSGVKTMVDKDWLAAQGYDMIYHRSRREGAYCLADPRVLEEFRNNLVEYVRRYGIAAYKFDWGHFACGVAGHRGHLPGETYGFEAGAENFRRAHQAFREANPEIFLFNTGWYSPWWLWTYDAVFVSGADYNFGLSGPAANSTAALLCTWRDATIRGNVVRWSPFFPIDSLMTVDPISYWWHEWDVRAESPVRPFTDYFLMAALRGTQMTEIYNNIAAWTDAHADAAAAVLKWTKSRDDVILAGTRYLGGDPLRAEPYGYAHFDRQNRGVIVVRNPDVESRSLAIPLDESTGMWPAAKEYALRVVYPYTMTLSGTIRYGATCQQQLEPDEVRVIEVWPLDGLPEPMPVGVRYQVVTREPGATTFRLASAAAELQLLSPVEIKDGVARREPGWYSTKLDGKLAGATKLAASAFAIRQSKTGCTASVDVPQCVRARVSLVFAGRGIDGIMTLDGKPVRVDAPHLLLPDVGNRTTGTRAQAADWSMFGLDVAPGRHELSFEATATGKSKKLPSARLICECYAEVRDPRMLRIEHAPLDRRGLRALPENWAWEMRATKSTKINSAP